MSCAGAATSGHGLTPLQVAAALKAIVASQVARHCADASGTAIPRRTKSGIAESYQTVDAKCYSEIHCVTTVVDGVEVTAREFAPEVFYYIRQVECMSERVFADEWTLPEDKLRLELGAGRSQALFLKSKTMEFMCKTIASEEVNVLMSVLPFYTKYVAENVDSLLMRFYMLLEVIANGETGYMLCFNDICSGPSLLNEKWDIKGRIPKPGKFMQFPHLVRRAYEPDPYLIDTPVNEAEAVSSNRDVVVVNAGDKHTLSTHKDKELTRLFWLEQPVREKLVKQLIMDYNFLGEVGLMDYSLLIGVSYNENKVSRSGRRYVVKNMKMVNVIGEEEGAVEVRPGGKKHNTEALTEFGNGVHSLFDQEIYYIGIIDLLTKYTFKKKTANFFKSFLWEENTLSTIPPEKYRDRITKYTKIVFPVVE